MPTMGTTFNEFGQLEPEIVSFTKRAIHLERRFQDNESAYAQIEKPFDRYLQTCGAVSWSWETLEFQKAVSEFVERFGYDRLSFYMAGYGNDLFATAKISLAAKSGNGVPWPDRALDDTQRRSAFHELWKLLTSDEMKQIQAEHAVVKWGSRAYQSFLEFRAYNFGTTATTYPRFRDFAFWFQLHKLKPDFQYRLGDTDLLDLKTKINAKRNLFVSIIAPDLRKSAEVWSDLGRVIPQASGEPLLKVAWFATMPGVMDYKDFLKLGIIATGMGYWNSKPTNVEDLTRV